AIIISGDLGVGKPNPDAFHHILTALDADAREATMVGDSITRDVDGAITAGLQAIWLNRFGRPRRTARPDVTEIATLIDLESALDDMLHQRSRRG
ncbi:MAG: HAD-IA family hydrolase, partial [Actinomycetota bacterium]|nr:HAD-IA family hydrolase [Actinomycetota bacterium]